MGAGSNPSVRRGDRKPVENVSWDAVTGPDGFLRRINTSSILAELAGQVPGIAGWNFRLPSETEWEYAARGGPHWTDGFPFSGANWAIHCTVSKRYEIAHKYHDGCIGFRLVLSP